MHTIHAVLAEGGAADAVKNAINALSGPASILFISIAALTGFLIWYRQLTKPVVAAGVGAATVLFFAASALDSNFVKIITKPDNVPIVMMMFAVGFFLWLAFRQAAINDERMERGEPLIEAGADDKVLVWPDLVYSELIALILCTAGLVVWAIILRAPLEQPAEPADDPIEAQIPREEIPEELPIEEPIRPIEPVEEPTMEEMADFDGDGVIDESDFETFRDLFGQQADDGSFNPAADFDGDGEVTLIDFQIFLELIASGDGE